MRYLKPHYYDRFVCSADKCPDTCCAGWQIVIDEESLEKYAAVNGAFGSRLKNSIDWEEGVFCQYDRRCSFLNEQNLCDLIQELGPDSLCDTCRMYPRHVEEYDGLRELSLSLSCPTAAEMILGCQEKVIFEESFTDEEDDFEDFDFLMFSQLEDARDVIFHILQNRSIDLRIRMASVCALADKFQDCIDHQTSFEIDTILARYEEANAGNLLPNLIKNSDHTFVQILCGDDDLLPSVSARQKISSYHWHLESIALLEHLERLRPEWNIILANTRSLLYAKGEDAYLKICHDFQTACGYDSPLREQWECIGEQLMMFFVYTYFCGSVYDDMVSTKMGLALFSTLWIQEFCMYRWLDQGHSLSFSDITEIAWRFAREVEHSDNNLDMLETWMVENF